MNGKCSCCEGTRIDRDAPDQQCVPCGGTGVHPAGLQKGGYSDRLRSPVIVLTSPNASWDDAVDLAFEHGAYLPDSGYICIEVQAQGMLQEAEAHNQETFSDLLQSIHATQTSV